MRSALALTLLVAATARAADGRSDERSLAVLDLAADPGAEQAARNLAGLITARLASYPVRVVGQEEVRTVLGFEKARAAAGCTDEGCLVEIGDTLGVRYLVHGALGRIVETWILRLTLTDLRSAAAVHRVVRKEQSEEALIGAAESAADELALAAGFGAAPAAAPPPPPRRFSANLKLGNAFASLSAFDFSQLNFSFDLEGDYFFMPQLAGFLQIGLVLGSGEDANQRELAMTIVPAAAGAKWYFLPGREWNPYAGLGLGMGFVSGLLGGKGDTSFTFNAMGGVEYMPWQRLGFNFEGSLNLGDFSAEDARRLRLALVHANFGLIYAW